jgi:hypothetical protein
VWPLDYNLRYAGLAALLENELSYAEVLVDQLAIFALIGVPPTVPSSVDPEPKSDWVDFLPH